VRTGLETRPKSLPKWYGNEKEMGMKSFCRTVTEVIPKYENGSEKQD
jgi:hypothetical protein